MKSVGIGIIVAAALAVGGSAWAHTANPAESATLPDWDRDAPAHEPVHLIVSVPDQRVDVYAGGELIANSRVSTGRKGYPTPTGVFSILQKKRHHRSNIYSRAPMPHMQRLTWSGIALHASDQVPDYPASHGCIRLPSEFAKMLFRFTEIGAHVIISDGKATPVALDHKNLVQPLALQRHAAARTDSEIDGSQGSSVDAPSIDAVSDENSNLSPVRILVTRRIGRELVRDVQVLLKELGYEPGKVDGWMGRDTGAAIARFQESRGLEKTGAMSEALVEELYRAAGRGQPPTGHLYVRRDFAPVFDVPVTITDLETPLGSHLFTAMDFGEDANKVRWLAVSLNHGVPDSSALEPGDENAEAEPTASTAKEALDRIEIPVAVRRWLSRMLTPGSSLAISDDGISRETLAKGTDFVVLTQ